MPAIETFLHTQRPDLFLAGRRRHTAVEFGAAPRTVGETAYPPWRIEGAVVDRAGERQQDGGAHDVSYPLAIVQPRLYPLLEILLDLVPARVRMLAHHVAMRAPHHAAERGMKTEILEGLTVIGLGNPLSVSTEEHTSELQ